MRLDRSVRLVLLGAFAVACGDATGTGRDGVLTISGEAVPPMTHRPDPSGAWQLTCDLALEASLRLAGDGGEARWTGATFTWRSIAGRHLDTETFSATDVAGHWGGDVIRSGEPRQTWISIWAPEPFRATLEYRYETSTGRSGSATHTIRCGPEEPPIAGRFVLSSINGSRPFFFGVEADTLTFFPNLMYITKGSMTGGPFVGQPEQPFAIGPEPYRLLDVDDVHNFELPVIYPGVAGGRTVHSGTTLTMTILDCCGRPNQTWRYDLLGTVAPTPSPSFVVTPEVLTFTAPSGSALPPEQRFEVRSSTAEQITEVSFGTTAPGAGEPGWAMGINGSSTPTSIWARPQTTNVAPGTYIVKLTVTSRRASSPKTVDVVYHITSP